MKPARPNIPARIDRLRRVIALIDSTDFADAQPGVTMDSLLCLGATRTLRACTNRLSYCGVTATCTWSKDTGLIAAWRAAAVRQIAKLEGRAPVAAA